MYYSRHSVLIGYKVILKPIADIMAIGFFFFQVYDLDIFGLTEILLEPRSYFY